MEKMAIRTKGTTSSAEKFGARLRFAPYTRLGFFRALGGGATVGALRHGPLAARVHGEVGRLAKGVDGGGGGGA